MSKSEKRARKGFLQKAHEFCDSVFTIQRMLFIVCIGALFLNEGRDPIYSYIKADTTPKNNASAVVASRAQIAGAFLSDRENAKSESTRGPTDIDPGRTPFLYPDGDDFPRYVEIIFNLVKIQDLKSISDLSCRFTINATESLLIRFKEANMSVSYFCHDSAAFAIRYAMSRLSYLPETFFLLRPANHVRLVHFADLVVAYDFFQRKNLMVAQKYLEHIKNSMSKALLITSNQNDKNPSIESTHKFSRMNLLKPPFNFPEPLFRFGGITTDKGAASYPKDLLLFPNISALPDLSFDQEERSRLETSVMEKIYGLENSGDRRRRRRRLRR